jgi:hypothetical protein
LQLFSYSHTKQIKIYFVNPEAVFHSKFPKLITTLNFGEWVTFQNINNKSWVITWKPSLSLWSDTVFDMGLPQHSKFKWGFSVCQSKLSLEYICQPFSISNLKSHQYWLYVVWLSWNRKQNQGCLSSCCWEETLQAIPEDSRKRWNGQSNESLDLWYQSFPTAFENWGRSWEQVKMISSITGMMCYCKTSHYLKGDWI